MITALSMLALRNVRKKLTDTQLFILQFKREGLTIHLNHITLLQTMLTARLNHTIHFHLTTLNQMLSLPTRIHQTRKLQSATKRQRIRLRCLRIIMLIHASKCSAFTRTTRQRRLHFS